MRSSLCPLAELSGHLSSRVLVRASLRSCLSSFCLALASAAFWSQLKISKYCFRGLICVLLVFRWVLVSVIVQRFRVHHGQFSTPLLPIASIAEASKLRPGCWRGLLCFRCRIEELACTGSRPGIDLALCQSQFPNGHSPERLGCSYALASHCPKAAFGSRTAPKKAHHRDPGRPRTYRSACCLSDLKPARGDLDLL